MNESSTLKTQAVTGAVSGESTTSGKIITLDGANLSEPIPIDHGNAPASPAASRTLPAEHFRYKGRRYRVFKRKPDPEANWYFQLERNKVRRPMSLNTASLKHAIAEAKLKIDLADAEREDDLRRSMVRPQQTAHSPMYQIVGRSAQWPDDLGVVDKLPILASSKTRRHYVWSLRAVLRFALQITDEQLDTLSAACLSKETTRRYFDRVAEESSKRPQAAANTYRRSANALFNTARSLFAPRALEAMAATFGLSLPDIAGFRAGRTIFGQRVASASEFQRPSDAVIRRTLGEFVKLGRTPGYTIPGEGRYCGEPLPDWLRRNIFIALGLELSCGLRIGEIKKSKWHWFQERNGHPQLCEYRVDVKNRTNCLDVRPVDPFWRFMNHVIDTNGWRGAPDEHCLNLRPRSHQRASWKHLQKGWIGDRGHLPFLVISHWLRWLGWTTQKTNHALRDYSASTITMKYGLERASSWCRHGQISTTQQHYSRFVDDEARDNPRLLAWFKWAK